MQSRKIFTRFVQLCNISLSRTGICKLYLNYLKTFFTSYICRAGGSLQGLYNISLSRTGICKLYRPELFEEAFSIPRAFSHPMYMQCRKIFTSFVLKYCTYLYLGRAFVILVTAKVFKSNFTLFLCICEVRGG